MCVWPPGGGLTDRGLPTELPRVPRPPQVVDSGWSLADGNVDVLLMKENKQNWWKTIMKGDPEINTQKARTCPVAGP